MEVACFPIGFKSAGSAYTYDVNIEIVTQFSKISLNKEK